ncbi:3-oxoacyl-ACP reductase family protein [Pelosinus baikalensis]|uniref:3-oxoacyl-ACP reductase FabG n=1 Tax=Pelosinus baikalensis TaxID=2892015 RepID=A0ABS8HU96_9FIRM|nr:3-oxoacyl-ACP reductase FabG [Pelosinus baikalensis]
MSLQGKSVIISGGTRGIGRGIVAALVEKGAKVAFSYSKNTVAADEVVSETKHLPGIAWAHQVDIKNQQQVKAMVAQVVKEWGGVDIVVNNAGIRRDKSIIFMAADDWNEVLHTNVTGAFHLTQAAIFYMLKKKSGRIINISSISGATGIAGQTNYSSSKAALFGFTRSLAKEVASYGICVNTIAPGGVETDMTSSLTDKQKEKLLQGVPIGRMCRVGEVVKMVEFLADDELAPEYLTGSVIYLDGGAGL